MPKKIVLSFLVVLLAAGLSACSVMQSTYQKKADEADTLTKRLAALQKRHDDLAAENFALKARNDGLLADLVVITGLVYVAGGVRAGFMLLYPIPALAGSGAAARRMTVWPLSWSTALASVSGGENT